MQINSDTTIIELCFIFITEMSYFTSSIQTQFLSLRHSTGITEALSDDTEGARKYVRTHYLPISTGNILGI